MATVPGMTDDAFDSAPAVEYGKPGKPFQAHYESRCSEIYDDIQPGDTIMADGHGGFAHASCIRHNATAVIWE